MLLALRSLFESGAVQVALSDAATAAESLAAQAQAPAADSGAGAESIAIAAPLASADSATGVDTLALAGQEAVADSGIGSDALGSAAQLPGVDSGIGSDVLGAAISDPMAEAGVGLDQVALAVQATLQDGATGVDVVTIAGNEIPVDIADDGLCDDALSTFAQALDQRELSAGGMLGRAIVRNRGRPSRSAAADRARGNEAVGVEVRARVTDSARACAALRIVKIDPDLELLALALAA